VQVGRRPAEPVATRPFQGWAPGFFEHLLRRSPTKGRSRLGKQTRTRNTSAREIDAGGYQGPRMWIPDPHVPAPSCW
jgi:hypothetical protein